LAEKIPEQLPRFVRVITDARRNRINGLQDGGSYLGTKRFTGVSPDGEIGPVHG
jgi:hypothetical protein